VNLYSVIPSSKGNKRRTLCAEHKVPVRQAYYCPADDERDPATIKAVEVTKGNYVIPETEPKEIPASDGIDFVAVPTVELDQLTISTDSLYYLQPHKTAVKAWEILYRLTRDAKVTLLGRAALRSGTSKIYRLVVFNDYLVLQAVEFPEHIREAPDREKTTVEKTLMGQAKKVLEAITVSVDDVDLTDEGLRRFLETTETGERVSITPESTTSEGEPIDLMDALKQSVEATKRKAS
jgi:non-homologous end joining protein Ku